MLRVKTKDSVIETRKIEVKDGLISFDDVADKVDGRCYLFKDMLDRDTDKKILDTIMEKGYIDLSSYSNMHEVWGS